MHSINVWSNGCIENSFDTCIFELQKSLNLCVSLFSVKELKIVKSKNVVNYHALKVLPRGEIILSTDIFSMGQIV